MGDSFLHKGLRRQLIETIQSKGIHDERILQAIGQVPRHIFMDSSFIKFSYKDQAFPIGEGQTISQPYTVAFQTQLLEVREGDKILEIGTGSGYQTAILLEMGAFVYTIERQRKLFLKAQQTLTELGYKSHFFFGDGFQGKPSYGGIMVIPVGNRQSQKMIRVIRMDENDYNESEHGYFTFVPMLKGTEE